jgi:hypothetical protein
VIENYTSFLFVFFLRQGLLTYASQDAFALCILGLLGTQDPLALAWNYRHVSPCYTYKVLIFDFISNFAKNYSLSC